MTLVANADQVAALGTLWATVMDGTVEEVEIDQVTSATLLHALVVTVYKPSHTATWIVNVKGATSEWPQDATSPAKLG